MIFVWVYLKSSLSRILDLETEKNNNKQKSLCRAHLLVLISSRRKEYVSVEIWIYAAHVKCSFLHLQVTFFLVLED